jgi:ankyrin repeat protein
LTAAWTRHQNNVVKYLLLRGAEPACLAGQWTYAMNDWRRLVYHLIKANTFVPLFKMLEFHIKMGPFYSNVQLIDLEIINSISTMYNGEDI